MAVTFLTNEDRDDIDKNIAEKQDRVISDTGEHFTVDENGEKTVEGAFQEIGEHLEVLDQSLESPWKGKTAVFYGDSLTEENSHYTKGYHAWLKEILGLNSYSNYGKSGYKLSDIYHKVNTTKCSADIVFVMGGVNDQTYSVPLGTPGDTTTNTTYGSLNLLCGRLKEKFPTSTIVFITPHYQTKYPHDEGITSYEISKAIKEVCERYAIAVYDNYVLSEISTDSLVTYTTDNCHWNDKAHELVGKNLANFVLNTFTTAATYTVNTNTNWVGRAVTVEKNFNETQCFAHLVALIEADESMQVGTVITATLKGNKCFNVLSNSYNGAPAYWDTSGNLDNSKYSGTATKGANALHTTTVTGDSLEYTVETREINRESGGAKYIKVPFMIFGSPNYGFTITEISVAFDGIEKPIIGLGAFFNSDKEIISVRDTQLFDIEDSVYRVKANEVSVNDSEEHFNSENVESVLHELWGDVDTNKTKIGWLEAEADSCVQYADTTRHNELNTKYGGYLSKLMENVCMRCIAPGWNDLPVASSGESTFIFINSRFHNSYNIQIAVEETTGRVWNRIILPGSGYVFRDWNLGEGDNVVKFVSNPATSYSATTGGLLAKITDNIITNINNTTTWTDMPSTESIAFINWRYIDNYNLQLGFGQKTGTMWFRIVNRNTGAIYTDWKSITSTDNCIQLRNVYGTQAGAASVQNKLSNITEPGTFGFSQGAYTDLPVNYPTPDNSIVMNIQQTAGNIIQMLMNMYSGKIWTRWIKVSDKSIVRDWCELDIQDGRLKILALGDSICRGYRNADKGFVGDLGFTYKNIGVSSATISNKVTDVMNIPDQLINYDSTDTANGNFTPDIIIGEGGINDYFRSAPMGELSTIPATTDEEAEALDRDTLLGGLEYLFYKMISLYPKAQRFFLITHKTWKTNESKYCPTSQNSEGYTQQDLHDKIIECCNIYSVKVIDIYKESMMNTVFPQYRSSVAYSTDNSITYTEYCDTDGVHPLDYGYKECYLPLIKKALGIGTVK